VWLGHLLRHASLLHDTIEGRMKGKAARGRENAAVERPDEKQKLHGSKMRSSRHSGLES